MIVYQINEDSAERVVVESENILQVLPSSKKFGNYRVSLLITNQDEILVVGDFEDIQQTVNGETFRDQIRGEMFW